MDTVTLTNRMIAEAAGWRFEQSGALLTVVYRPNGERVRIHTDFGLIVDLNEAQVNAVLPDCLHDANAALSLVADTWFSLAKWSHISGQDMMYTAEVEGHRYEADTPASAICRAWYAYSQRTSGAGGERE